MMKTKTKCIVLALIAILMISGLSPISARPMRAPFSPPRQPRGTEVLQGYMELSNEMTYYMSLRHRVLDTNGFMSLESRRALAEDLLLYIPQLERRLEGLESYGGGEFDLLNLLASKAVPLIAGNGEYSEVIGENLAAGGDVSESLKNIGKFLEYERGDMMNLALSIYSMQLALGEKRVSFSEYESQLSKQYAYCQMRLALNDSMPALDLGTKSLYLGAMPAIMTSPDGGSDKDGDGLTDFVEESLGTDKWLSDSDGDGIGDYDEIYKYATDPMDQDTDNDGVSDGKEVEDGTDPLRKESLELPMNNPFYNEYCDTDGDGLSDKKEVAIGTDYRRQDTDSDGISDSVELELGLDPLSKDSDLDGSDDLKDLYPLDPTLGQSGIDIHDDEELSMIIYGAIAAGAVLASLFGCSSCTGIAVRATIELINLYEKELEERASGSDE